MLLGNPWRDTSGGLRRACVLGLVPDLYHAFLLAFYTQLPLPLPSCRGTLMALPGRTGEETGGPRVGSLVREVIYAGLLSVRDQYR